MRKILLLILASILMNASVASADMFFLKIHNTTVEIPATGSTMVSVPVSLEIDGPVPGNLLLDFYEMGLDVGSAGILPPGVSFSMPPDSDDVGASSLMTNFPVDSTVPVSFASIGIGANAATMATVPNVTTSSTLLFTLDLNISASATPQTLAIAIPNNPLHTTLKFPRFAFIDDPSTTGVDESMISETLALSPASGALTITAIPEPSQLILGFLMCGLTVGIASKKFASRKADDAK